MQKPVSLSVHTIQKMALEKIQEESASYAVPANDTQQRRISSAEVYKALKSGQDGDAWLFVQLHRNRFIYDHSAGQWYQWDEHYWREDRIQNTLTAVDAVIDIYSQEARMWAKERLKASQEGRTDDAKHAESLEDAYIRRINELQNLQRKRSILTLAAAGERGLSTDGEAWDRDPWLLGCPNGVVDLRTGSFRPGRQKDFIKTCCPTAWKGLDVDAPTWKRALQEIFNRDVALIRYLQRLFGYAVTGLTTEHVLPLLWGQGRNGKGTVLEVIAHVLGPLAGPIQAEMLLEQGRARSSAGPSSDIMALRGRRIAWASETEEGRRLNVSRVKWLVGGDTLTGRAPYGKYEVSFPPTHTLFLLTNAKPRADASDFALWQRIHLIPFQLSFIDNPQAPTERLRDLNLSEKLRAEAPGILAWIVQGCLMWQRDGLNPPNVVRAATKEYRENEDLLGRFIDECCTVHPQAMVAAGKLRKAYEQWCSENGYRPKSGNKFSEYLINQRDFDRNDDGRHRIYLGICLKPDQGDTPMPDKEGD